MRIWRSVLGFGAACAALWLLGQTAPAWNAASAAFDEAVTITGARIYLRLGRLTFAFDRGLMEFLGGKWRDLCAMSAQLFPPGAAEAIDATAGAIRAAIGTLIG